MIQTKQENCVAYYRVSTKKQGISGLGLEAQRSAVLSYVNSRGCELVEEYTEIESGKDNNRPQLQAAINQAKQISAVVLIAKLDRLSRNMTFISQLMDENVRFICCDMPEANELTIHIFAAVAQFERLRISERIKEALRAKREREPEWQPGTPQNLTDAARKKAHRAIRQNAIEAKANRHAWHFIRPLREQGMTYEAIAERLNAEGYRTRQGKKFRSWQVWNIYSKFKRDENEKRKVQSIEYNKDGSIQEDQP